MLLPLALLAVPAPDDAAARRDQRLVLVQRDDLDVLHRRVLVLLERARAGRARAPAPAPAHDPARLRLRLQVDAVPDRRRLHGLRGARCSSKLQKSPERPVVAWAAGITVMWGLLAVLFVGWADNVKSYRSVFVDMTEGAAGEVRLHLEPRPAAIRSARRCTTSPASSPTGRKSRSGGATAISCSCRASRSTRT